MQIKSIDGDITWGFDTSEAGLTTLYANGNREKLPFYDVIQLMRLLDNEQVRLSVARELEKAPKVIRDEIGEFSIPGDSKLDGQRERAAAARAAKAAKATTK